MKHSPHNSHPGLKHRSLRSESGYVLLVLMFFVTLLTFSMMAVLPRAVQQVKRDREEEMIHRGTEYARAIKKFYKRFQRYPNSLQDLESTNNLRFIRRRFKDPLTKGGNWKLLHVTDVQQGIANPNFGVSQASNFNPLAAQAATAATVAAAGGQSGNLLGAQGQGAAKNDPGTQNGSTDQEQQDNGGDTSKSGSPAAGGSSPFNSPGGAGQTGQTYGAGGIVGVASMSKAKTIREFNNKSNYNKWMFIYDPTQDRGMLLKGPYNPQAFQGNNNNMNQGGQTLPGAGGPQQNGSPGSGIGTAPSPQMPPDQNAPPQ